MDLGSFGDPDGLEHQMKCYIGPNDDDLSILNRKIHEKYLGSFPWRPIHEIYAITSLVYPSSNQKLNAGFTD